MDQVNDGLLDFVGDLVNIYTPNVSFLGEVTIAALQGQNNCLMSYSKNTPLWRINNCVRGGLSCDFVRGVFSIVISLSMEGFWTK